MTFNGSNEIRAKGVRRTQLAACAWALGLDRERVAAWYRR